MTGVLSFTGAHVVLVSVARRAVGRWRHGYVPRKKLLFFPITEVVRNEGCIRFGICMCQVEIMLYIAADRREAFIHRGILQPD